MDQRPRPGSVRVHREGLFDQWQRRSQAALVVPMDLTEDIARLDSLAGLLFKIESDGRVDKVVDAGPSGPQRV